MSLIKTSKQQEIALKTLCILLVMLSSISCRNDVTNDTTRYENGYVFNGKRFEKKNFYVIDGKFIFNTSKKDIKVVDLNNRYVIPPFGDAHTHNFDNLEKFDSIYKAYINEGTFYALVLNNHYSNYLKIKDSLNKPGKIDAKFAHGGLTSTGGHPHFIYESQALGYSWNAMFDPVKKEEVLKAKSSNNDAYYLIDTIEDLNNKWNDILRKQPDILKVYLLNTSTRISKIKNKQFSLYGISEEVLKKVIKRAKQERISIWAHVETVDDFEIAIKNGVTNFAHMPGYGGGLGDIDYSTITISDSLLRAVSNRNIVMSPQVSLAKYYSTIWNGKNMSLDSTVLRKKFDFLKTQLRRLKDANFNIVLGADQNDVTLTQEIDAIVDLGVFSNLELIQILTSSSKYIFPNRKIGEIKEGYEASFLILENNPLDNIQNIKNIKMKIKNGMTIN